MTKQIQKTYEEKLTGILDQLNAIRRELNAQDDRIIEGKENLDWGTIGSMTRIQEQLTDIEITMNIKEEKHD